MTETENTRHDAPLKPAEADRFDPMDDLNLPLGANRTLVTGEAPGSSLADLVNAYGEAMAKAAMHLAMNGVAAAVAEADRAQELKAEILKRYDELPAGADEDALDSVDALRSKLMNLDGGRATWVLHHLATIERALRARFDA